MHVGDLGWIPALLFARSEEHTSELQSHSDLHSFPTRRSSDIGAVMLEACLRHDALSGNPPAHACRRFGLDSRSALRRAGMTKRSETNHASMTSTICEGISAVVSG